jgi:hypothetical protein
LEVNMTKYAPVAEFLSIQEQGRVRLGFDDVEAILGAALPKSAADYQAWWANDPTHSQAKAWLDAGWQTENLNLQRRVVEFVRVRNRPAGPPASPAPASFDPWGALAGSVTIHDEVALVAPSGETWDAERDAP